MSELEQRRSELSKKLAFTKPPIIQATLGFKFSGQITEATEIDLKELFPEFSWQRLIPTEVSMSATFNHGKKSSSVKGTVSHDPSTLRWLGTSIPELDDSKATILLQEGELLYAESKAYQGWDAFTGNAISKFNRLVDKGFELIGYSKLRYLNLISKGEAIDYYIESAIISRVFNGLQTSYDNLGLRVGGVVNGHHGKFDTLVVHSFLPHNTKQNRSDQHAKVVGDYMIDTSIEPKFDGTDKGILEELNYVKNLLFYNSLKTDVLKNFE